MVSTSKEEEKEERARRARIAKWFWRAVIVPWNLFFLWACVSDWDTVVEGFRTEQLNLVAIVALVLIVDVSFLTQAGTDEAQQESARAD